MPYLMAMMAQLLIPCHYGQQLIEVSKDLSMSLFHAHYNCAEKNFTILLELLKKPKKLRSFFIFDISMDMFLTIFNASYSLYAVLKSMK